MGFVKKCRLCGVRKKGARKKGARKKGIVFGVRKTMSSLQGSKKGGLEKRRRKKGIFFFGFENKCRLRGVRKKGVFISGFDKKRRLFGIRKKGAREGGTKSGYPFCGSKKSVVFVGFEKKGVRKIVPFSGFEKKANRKKGSKMATTDCDFAINEKRRQWTVAPPPHWRRMSPIGAFPRPSYYDVVVISSTIPSFFSSFRAVCVEDLAFFPSFIPSPIVSPSPIISLPRSFSRSKISRSLSCGFYLTRRPHESDAGGGCSARKKSVFFIDPFYLVVAVASY